MSAQAPEKNLFVDDIVTALTGPVDATGHSTTALKDQMRRAADEFDKRTAEAFARALLESLCQEKVNLRRLEALLILGLAHPTILDHHRVSLRTEGRRLASMLENEGQSERARCLIEVIEQRLGPEDDFVVDAEEGSGQPRARVEEEIDAFMQKADQCAARGQNMEAIRWLQEIVTLDRNRRDVARMIRDLRWSEKERKARLRQRFKLVGVALLLCGLVTGIVMRESYIDLQYRDLPPTTGELPSLNARLEGLDSLVSSNRVWFGMGTVLREQIRLRREISALEGQAAERAHEVAASRARQTEAAEAAESRGMLLAQQGHFEEALADLRQALVLSDPTWSRRPEIQANVTAIEAWMKKSR